MFFALPAYMQGEQDFTVIWAQLMSTPPDIKYHECEIVISIVLKIPIYIEPIVIEKNGVCHEHSQQKPDIKSLEVESVKLIEGRQSVVDADVTTASVYSLTRLWEKLSQSAAGLRHAFDH